MAYQCCYTNLLRYDGPYKVGGWTVTAFSRDIPPEVLRDCERFQRADASDERATDEFGADLRLYELLCAGNYAYVMRTRYGMLDHMGRGNNLFSHAYIFPMEDVLERPEVLCGLSASAFAQEAGPGIAPETESAELARQALARLQEGRLQELPSGDIPDFQSALDGAGFSANREAYKTLLQCVYAHMDAKRESGRQIPPLYIQYGAGADNDRQIRRVLCCILHGLPRWMRRELRASNWTELDNTPKDLIFTTEDVTRLSGGNGAYLVLQTGARNVDRRRMARLERCGYLPYAALKLAPEDFPAFFAGLERYAQALGDTDGASETARKLVFQCYWDAERREFTERPNIEALNRKELISLLSDAAGSGLYSMGMREVISAARKRISLETLTESLRETLEDWEAEYRRRHGIPQKPPETAQKAMEMTPESPETEITMELPETQPEAMPDAEIMPETSQVTESRPPLGGDVAERQRGDKTPLLPVKDWEAVERDWRELPAERRESMRDWLENLLNDAPNVPVAEAMFRRQTEKQSARSLDLYFRLMIDREVSGKISPRALMRAYCNEELSRTRGKSPGERWNTLSELCSICERMQAADLAERIREEAWERYKKELTPCEAEGRAVTLLRMYEEITRRLDPDGSESAWNGDEYAPLSHNARKYYWDMTEGNWKYFSFLALPEYEAFDDGKRHMFPTLIRLANSFRPKKAREFLKQVRLFFEMSDTPDYYTDENRLRITSLLFEELDRRHAGTLPADYRGWMNLATVAAEKNTIPAIQELYEAMFPFDAWKLTDCYPRFVWKCKDGGDRKAREAAYPLVREACFEYDARQPVPLDLWITLGIEALSFYELYNCFAIFERIPDAAVLDMDAAEVVRESSLMSSPAVRDYAQAYLKYRGETKIRQAVRNWLNELPGGKKKRFGVF